MPRIFVIIHLLLLTHQFAIADTSDKALFEKEKMAIAADIFNLDSSYTNMSDRIRCKKMPIDKCREYLLRLKSQISGKGLDLLGLGIKGITVFEVPSVKISYKMWGRLYLSKDVTFEDMQQFLVQLPDRLDQFESKKDSLSRQINTKIDCYLPSLRECEVGLDKLQSTNINFIDAGDPGIVLTTDTEVLQKSLRSIHPLEDSLDTIQSKLTELRNTRKLALEAKIEENLSEVPEDILLTQYKGVSPLKDSLKRRVECLAVLGFDDNGDIRFASILTNSKEVPNLAFRVLINAAKAASPELRSEIQSEIESNQNYKSWSTYPFSIHQESYLTPDELVSKGDAGSIYLKTKQKIELNIDVQYSYQMKLVLKTKNDGTPKSVTIHDIFDEGKEVFACKNLQTISQH